MRITAMGIVGLFLASFLAMGLWPETAYFGSPSQAMAQEVSTPKDPFGGSAVEKAKTQEKAQTQPAIAKKTVSPPKKTISRLSHSSPRTQAIKEALDSPANLEYGEVPFNDVKLELEDKFGINIVLDQSAIDDALSEEELVTVRLRGIKLKNAIRLMLYDFNATYVIGDEVLRIISLSNVGDPENFSQRIVKVKSVLQTIGRNDSRASDLKSPISPESLLIKTITSVVQRDQWAISGQGEAVIEIIGGVLVMRGPELLMDETTDFLKDLEAALSAQD